MIKVSLHIPIVVLIVEDVIEIKSIIIIIISSLVIATFLCSVNQLILWSRDTEH